MTALEDALAAFNDSPHMSQEARLERAQKLNEWGLFSKNHIREITKLPYHVIASELQKSGKEGGKFNPEMLPLIYDFEQSVLNRAPRTAPDLDLLKIILSQGVSRRFLCRLLSVPNGTMDHWVSQYGLVRG